MTELSIIIISYDRKLYLKRCIQSILNQQSLEKFSQRVEVIISTNDHREISGNWIQKLMKKGIDTKLICSTKHGIFNRSLARNTGVKSSKGKKILFVDSDIILSPDFLLNFQSKFLTPMVGIHYLYGYKIALDDCLAKEMLSDTFIPSCDQLKSLDFSDYREQSFQHSEFNSSDKTKLWASAWSGILSVPKRFYEEISGFDENYLGWGGEDTDFAYRLARKAYPFEVIRDAYGIHLPHKRDKGTGSAQTNRNYFDGKMFDSCSELASLYPSFLIEGIREQIQNSYILNLNHSDSDIKGINEELVKYGKTMSVGLASIKEINMLNFDVCLVVTNNTTKMFREVNSEKKILERVGVKTEFEYNYFDVVYIFDALQFLPGDLYMRLLKELKRISKKIVETSFVNEVLPYKKNEYVGKYFYDSSDSEKISELQ